MKEIYHSALFDELKGQIGVKRVDYQQSTALVYDVISDVVPNEFFDCDLIYTEPCWKDGFNKFNDRAGVTSSRTYQGYIASMNDIILKLNVPTVVITGKHALRYWLQPNQMFESKLVHGSNCVALVYNFKLDRPYASVVDMLPELAAKFNKVGDFNCGYGYTGKIFAGCGKNFVISDYNAKCIGYISNNIKGWFK